MPYRYRSWVEPRAEMESDYSFQVPKMWQVDHHNFAEVLLLRTVAVLSPWASLPMEALGTTRL